MHINRLQQVLVNACCSIVPAPRLESAGRPRAASTGGSRQMPLHLGRALQALKNIKKERTTVPSLLSPSFKRRGVHAEGFLSLLPGN